MDNSSQFDLASLLRWVAAWSFFFASSRWAVTSTMLGLSDTFFVYAPGFPLFRLGLIIGPFLCLGFLLAIASLMVWNFKASISSLLFLGYGGLALLSSWWAPLSSGGSIGNLWQSGSRILSLMVLCVSASFLETRYRKLTDWHRLVPRLAMGATVGYYLHLAAIVVCSSE